MRDCRRKHQVERVGFARSSPSSLWVGSVRSVPGPHRVRSARSASTAHKVGSESVFVHVLISLRTNLSCLNHGLFAFGLISLLPFAGSLGRKGQVLADITSELITATMEQRPPLTFLVASFFAHNFFISLTETAISST
ncbi:hypothetical protein VNO78_16263 [Psophocarpus tetragonolobus]|uniref:Uncharacterized protein n=1 Tax=Psophocarpus tetragonolobus TaxID=3891 RepID=A0AAN9XJY6_PSOTE